MKKSGRSVEKLTEKQIEAVELYYNSDLSSRDVAEKYGITQSGLRYWTNKYKKEFGGVPDGKKTIRG